MVFFVIALDAYCLLEIYWTIHEACIDQEIDFNELIQKKSGKNIKKSSKCYSKRIGEQNCKDLLVHKSSSRDSPSTNNENPGPSFHSTVNQTINKESLPKKIFPSKVFILN